MSQGRALRCRRDGPEQLDRGTMTTYAALGFELRPVRLAKKLTAD